MSPLSVRRYRAERLLRREFEGLRGRVLAHVRGRLRASGASLDQSDLEACYGQAWQGLYMAVLEGQEIVSPEGWLVLVTFRRAIEEHRARGRVHRGALARDPSGAADVAARAQKASGREHDLAGELDDRVRLRQLFEGLRGRLDERERQAAALCYLQGLSRSEAAVRMGVSDARMRKLMEGRGSGRLGVAGKVGVLVDTIRDGGWCEEQGSLMRALAYGVLDPEGERYRLAVLHRGQCPACRAYVASLRGLAAALPPVCLPWGLGAGVLAHAGKGVHAGGAPAAAGSASGAGTGAAGGAVAGGGGAGAGLQAGRGIGGALSASGAACAGGAAGGGWLIGAGPLGAKLAVGCLLALGVGAGCIALERGHRVPAPRHTGHSASQPGGRAAARSAGGYLLGDLAASASTSLEAAVPADGAVGRAAVPLTPAGRASREFGPEQSSARSAAGAVASAAQRAPAVRSASSGSGQFTAAASSSGRSSSAEVSDSASSQTASVSSASDSVAAEREFAPG